MLPIWAAIAVLAAAPKPTEPEDVPLQAIGAKKNEPPPPPSRPARKQLGLLIGPKLGGQFGVAGPMGRSMLAGVEVGYRLPIWQRVLGLSIELTFANPGASDFTPLGTLRTSSVWLSLPLYASASFDLGPGLLRLLTGPALEWWRAHSTLSGSEFTFDDVTWALGAAALISYGFHLGPGALGVELRYRYGLPVVAARGLGAHSLGISVAYMFIL